MTQTFSHGPLRYRRETPSSGGLQSCLATYSFNRTILKVWQARTIYFLGWQAQGRANQRRSPQFREKRTARRPKVSLFYRQTCHV